MINHKTPAPHPIAPASELIPQAAELYAAAWLPRLHQAGSRGVRTEDDLHLALRVLFAEEIRAGRVELQRNAVLRHPSIRAAWYEVDLLLRHPESGAEGAIELDDYRTHDRDPSEFADSRRRWREIRRAGIHLTVLAAAEVRADVWGVGLEVVDLLGCVWTGFGPVELPSAVRTKAEGFSAATRARTAREVLHTAVPEGLPVLEEIRRTLSALPVAPDPEYEAHRERHPRYGALYAPLEDQYLTRLHAAGVSIQAIEQAMLRPASALRRRLRRLGGEDANGQKAA